MRSYTLRVIKIIKETEDTVTICFKQPAIRKINYKSGQYLTVVVSINNRKYKRPYSLSSAPEIDSTLNITVKRLFQGIVSNHLIDVVKENDLLEIIEPMGNFVYQHDLHNEQNIFLWGAGSGITPLMSILKAVLYTGSQKISLAYCNKSFKQTIFREQLAQLKAKYDDRFLLTFFLTEEVVNNAICERIDSKYVNKILRSMANGNNTIHYVCGPAGLKATVTDALYKEGINKEQIFSEDFEHIINEKELEGVQTRLVEIEKEKIRINVEVVRGKTILEAGLDSGIDLPYSCQTGSCTLCKGTLLEGEVKSIGNEKPEQPLKDHERLLCCSYPLTDNVKFRID